MKRFLVLLAALSAGCLLSAQEISIQSVDVSEDASLGEAAALVISAPFSDLTVKSLSGHDDFDFFQLDNAGGLYQYKVIVPLDDEEQRNIRRNFSFYRKGNVYSVNDIRRYKPGMVVHLTLSAVEEPIRIEPKEDVNAFYPSATESCVEIFFEKDNLNVEVGADGVPAYQIKKMPNENDTWTYTVVIDLTEYLNEIKPALEAGVKNDAKRFALEEKAAAMITPSIWISTNQTNRALIQVDTLLARGKRSYYVLLLGESEYFNALNNAEKNYASGEYARARALYRNAQKASDKPGDGSDEFLREMVSKSDKLQKLTAQAQKYFKDGERVRKQQKVLTSEVDSARVYYYYAEHLCNNILELNAKDQYASSTLSRIRHIREDLLKRVVYGTVFDRIKQYQKLAGVSVYAVDDKFLSAPNKVIGKADYLLGTSDAEGDFRVDIKDHVRALLFVHDTDKNYRTPAVEQIPADLNRKLTVYLSPKNINN